MIIQRSTTNDSYLPGKQKVGGPFNNYVDKIRGEGVKNVCFCPHSVYKNCPHRREGGVKKGQNSVHVVVE